MFWQTPLYLVGRIFFVLNQQLLVIHSRDEPLPIPTINAEIDPKKHVFGNLEKFQEVKTFTRCLKFMTRHNFIENVINMYFDNNDFHNFFVYPSKNPAYGGTGFFLYFVVVVIICEYIFVWCCWCWWLGWGNFMRWRTQTNRHMTRGHSNLQTQA